MKMDSITVCSRQKSVFPFLSIVKASILAVVTVFILCVPLGDPSNYCDYSETDPAGRGTKCSLCDVYLLWTRLARNTARAIDFVFHALKAALYQTKLKIYSILEKIDKEDLCRSICCSESVDSGDLRRGSCRCKRKCNRTR